MRLPADAAGTVKCVRYQELLKSAIRLAEASTVSHVCGTVTVDQPLSLNPGSSAPVNVLLAINFQDPFNCVLARSVTGSTNAAWASWLDRKTAETRIANK